MTGASQAQPLAATPARPPEVRDDRWWLLRFARFWYVTRRLKRRWAAECWGDRWYYQMVFALEHCAGLAEGDKFASVRAKVTRGIDKDRRTARVLDLGTGLGFQARSIWDHGYRNVFACDVVSDRIALARRLQAATAIHFLIGDMQALGFATGSLEAITIAAALHDLAPAGVEVVLAECDRTLKAGGRLVLLEPRSQRDLTHALHRWAYRVCGRLLDESLHVDGFLRLDLAARLAGLGYVLVSREVLWHSVLCLYTFEKRA